MGGCSEEAMYLLINKYIYLFLELRLIKGEVSDNDADELAEALSQYPLPEYCPLCSELLNKPVMTKCEHIFCEACAL